MLGYLIDNAPGKEFIIDVCIFPTSQQTEYLYQGTGDNAILCQQHRQGIRPFPLFLLSYSSSQLSVFPAIRHSVELTAWDPSDAASSSMRN